MNPRLVKDLNWVSLKKVFLNKINLLFLKMDSIENSAEIKAFINDYRQLFWYTPEAEKERISHELLVETILNYGDMEAVKRLFEVMGINEAAKVFFAATGRKKLNYFPEIHHFFTLVFKRYAQ